MSAQILFSLIIRQVQPRFLQMKINIIVTVKKKLRNILLPVIKIFSISITK